MNPPGRGLTNPQQVMQVLSRLCRGNSDHTCWGFINNVLQGRDWMGEEYELPWDGRPFKAPFLAFDTETAVVDKAGREYDLSREIQPLVLATVSDGKRSAVLYPQQMPKFIRMHSSTLLVGHNLQFDYWVVRKFLEEWEFQWDSDTWQEMADKGFMDDTMLLDFLVRLADGSMLMPE